MGYLRPLADGGGGRTRIGAFLRLRSSFGPFAKPQKCFVSCGAPARGYGHSPLLDLPPLQFQSNPVLRVFTRPKPAHVLLLCSFGPCSDLPHPGLSPQEIQAWTLGQSMRVDSGVRVSLSGYAISRMESLYVCKNRPSPPKPPPGSGGSPGLTWIGFLFSWKSCGELP